VTTSPVAAPSPASPPPVSAWAPLRNPIYRGLWTAQLVSNIGTWMQNVGAAWLMGSLGGSAALVALVQSAVTLPVFLTALPAGAIADIVDRRRLLLWTQTWMLLSAAALAELTWQNAVTPGLLLALTFSLGLGTAINMPAWQAIQPELVPRREFPQAVALGSASVNVGRAIGPAIGGVLVATAGSEAVFAVNALSFLGILVVLFTWRREASESDVPAERLSGAVRAGLRYVRHSPALRAVLTRSATFMIAASSFLALLPVVARSELDMSAAGFGLLLTCFGAGAVIATATLPRLRERVSIDRLVVGATLVVAVALGALAAFDFVGVAIVACLLGGVAWVLCLSSFNVSAQRALPSWVRARGMGFYLLTVQGGTAAGAALWGTIASRFDVRVALACAAGTLALGTLTARRFRLASGEKLDLRSAPYSSEPTLIIEPRPEQGPVLVTLEYRVAEENADAFAEAMRKVGRVRRRTGARRWGLFRDPAEPSRFLETFVVDSWEEHLRQHQRVTATDRRVEDEARALAEDSGEPRATHYVSAYG
jgi:MFS family permease